MSQGPIPGPAPTRSVNLPASPAPEDLAQALTRLRDAGLTAEFIDLVCALDVYLDNDGIWHQWSIPCGRVDLPGAAARPGRMSISDLTGPGAPGSCSSCFTQPELSRITGDSPHPHLIGRSLATIALCEALEETRTNLHSGTLAQRERASATLPHLTYEAGLWNGLVNHEGAAALTTRLGDLHHWAADELAREGAPYRQRITAEIAACMGEAPDPELLDYSWCLCGSLDPYALFPEDQVLAIEATTVFRVPRVDDYLLMVVPRFVADFLIRWYPTDALPLLTAPIDTPPGAQPDPALIETVSALWDPRSSISTPLQALAAARGVLATQAAS